MTITLNTCGRAVVAAFALLSTSLYATDIPQNLGSGLDKLVESRVITKADATRGIYGGYATEQAQNYANMAITDGATNRVLVDIVPTGTVDIDTLKSTLTSLASSITITSVDYDYRHTGLIEAYVSLDDAAVLATTAGVRSMFLGLKPYLRHGPVQAPSVVAGDHLYKIGTAFDQGVIQHRVDRINQIYNPAAPVNYDGSGMSIGLLSDSFNTSGVAPAPTGVANFDLPGSPANPWNTQPVVVLADEPGGTDEGRGMVEIAYKMAPRARLAFATADAGELQFANNIRALAALPGFTYPAGTQQGFKADTIADDVGYFDEPWYEDGVISNAIDDVTAAGVSYFSSAGNDIGINGYESPLRIVPNGTGLTAAAGNTALAGTNINLATVPTNLYAGGFHNFNPAPGGLDVAQLVNMTSAQNVIMQWDDPYDTKALTGTQIFSASATISNAVTTVTFGAPTLPVFNQGTVYVIAETATSGTFDGTITILDAGNNVVYTQDYDVDETVNFFPPATGQYSIRIGRFSTTTGNFNLTVTSAVGTLGVTSDFNLLVFSTAGVYLPGSSITANNLANNRPLELGAVARGAGTPRQVQFVISRSNIPTATQLPTRVRYLIPGNGASGLGPAEYFSYNTVTTGGHATARGSNGMAAYDVFRPSLPETFSSPGPATILFDSDSKRLPSPEIRQQPRLAAADDANTSFFGNPDSTSDLDTLLNFSGTSAAGPHAAAIAALVLQAHGGPGSVTPAQMTSILQASTFPHDLDPSFASGSAPTSDGGTVSITISSDGDVNAGTGENDPSSFQVSYSGPGSLASLTFNPAGTAAGGGNVTGGNNGVQDDAGSLPPTVSYFDNSFPGMAFADLASAKVFTLGPLTGVTAADIVTPLTAAPFTGFSNQPPAPANITGVFDTMTIGFPTANFGNGAAMHFTVGRVTQHSAAVGTVAAPVNGQASILPIADLFGGGVQIPSGVVINDGMTFSGTTTGGGTFSGTIKNAIGKGYSVVDGYGFIDAAAATSAFVATASATPSSGYRGDTTLLSVKVTPATSPASTSLAVNANLGGIGGSTSQAFVDGGADVDGNHTFTFTATVGPTAAAGNKTLPVVITDAQGRVGTTSMNYTVLASTSPSGIGAATPSSIAATVPSLLTVAVTNGIGPISTGITVKADLTSIGGSAATVFHDDGLNGDAVGGDGTYSFNAIAPLGTAAGLKSLPVTITDAQARSGSASIALTILASTSPSGTGVASPASVAVTGSSVLTVTATAGTNPSSTGLTVNADLSSIGGSAAQAFVDNGDGTFSFNATVPLGTSAGLKSLPATISDLQSRSGSTNIALTVLAPTSPTGTGLASPNSAIVGATSLFTVTVVNGTNPASSGVTVTADLSSIGGSATQALTDDGNNGDATAGDGVYSFLATVGNTATLGPSLIPVTIADAQSRTGSAFIAFNVPSPNGPTGTGLSTPTTVNLGFSTVLIVAVTPGSSPTSTGLTVTVDLSSIGGSATQTFYDDGSNGDQVAGDNIFSFSTTLPMDPTLLGAQVLPATITDAQSRTGGAMILVNVTDTIFKNDFE